VHRSSRRYREGLEGPLARREEGRCVRPSLAPHPCSDRRRSSLDRPLSVFFFFFFLFFLSLCVAIPHRSPVFYSILCRVWASWSRAPILQHKHQGLLGVAALIAAAGVVTARSAIRRTLPFACLVRWLTDLWLALCAGGPRQGRSQKGGRGCERAPKSSKINPSLVRMPSVSISITR